MKKFFTLLFGIALLATPSYGQNHICAFDEDINDLLQRYPEKVNWFSETLPQLLEAYRTQESLIPEDSTFIIPVVVHVFHNGGPENISDAQVFDMIRVMNEDYSFTHADTALVDSTFRGVQASMQIEFRLARLDPDSNCTTGILRHRTRLANDIPQGFKTFGWDNRDYLNIYLVGGLYGGGGGGTLIGYAMPPGFNVPLRRDGIANRSDYAGTIGTALGLPVGSRGGSVLSHEGGHYVGLMHTFQDGCSALLDNDYCTDTPPVDAPNYGPCTAQINSCNFDVPDLPDNIENYMDYTDNECMRMFTEQQRDIAHFSLSSVFGRKRLVEYDNLVDRGVFLDPSPCAPQPDYIIEDEVVLVGDTVVLHGNAYNGTVTSHTWDFPGGTIASGASDSTVKVVYAQGGTYDFQYTVGNNEGFNTRIYTDRLVVLDTAVQQTGPAIFDFEDVSGDGAEPFQVLVSELGNGFAVTADAAAGGIRSLKLDNFAKFAPAVNREYQKDEVYFGPFDGTSLSNYNVSFDYAFAAKENFTEDLVRIWLSTNGTSWSPRGSISMNSLPTDTAIYQMQPFIPSAGHSWGNKQVSVALAQNDEKFWIRIEYIGKYGNNFYMDNLYIGTEVGLAESGKLALAAYPNPANDHLTLAIGGEDLVEAQLELVDLSGRTVLRQELPALLAGSSHRVAFPNTLATGSYILRIQSNKGQFVEPWIIE